MTVTECIKLINEENSFSSLHEVDDVIGNRAKLVSRGQDLDSYRWYSFATNVYQCDDGYVGVMGPYQLFSEQMSYSDLDIACFAEAYQAIQSIEYRPK